MANYDEEYFTCPSCGNDMTVRWHCESELNRRVYLVECPVCHLGAKAFESPIHAYQNAWEWWQLILDEYEEDQDKLAEEMDE